MNSKNEKLPSYKDFQQLLKKKILPPVILLFGEEDFLIDEAVQDLIKVTVPQEVYAFNVDVIDGEKAEVKDVLSLVSSYPMMNEKRVVVVREALKFISTEKDKELLQRYVLSPVETSCFVLVGEKKPDFRVKLFAELKKSGAVYEFPRLYEHQVPAWIENRLKNCGKSIEPEAAIVFLSVVGTSLRSLNNEIEKLLTFIGDKQTVTTDDILAVVGVTRGATVFDLQNAIGERNFSKALAITKALLNAKESPQGIIVMLTRYILQLIKTKELYCNNVPRENIASELKIHPFFIDGYINAAQRFSMVEFESALLRLRDVDIQLKTSAVTENHAMEILLYSILFPQRIEAHISVN